jgi:hypothetical protein
LGGTCKGHVAGHFFSTAEGVKMQSRICAGAIALLVFLCTSRAQAIVTIDTLGQGSFTYSATGANVINGLNQSSVDTINGMRATLIDHLFDGGTSTLSLATGGPLTATGGNFAVNLGYGETYIPFGMSATPDLNLNVSGNNALRVSFGSATNGVSIQTYLVTHTGNIYGQIDNNGMGTSKAAGAGDAIIPFSALTNMTNGGVNFSDIDSILLSFQSQGTFTITQVAAVPEPAVLAPLALLLIGGRRRK